GRVREAERRVVEARQVIELQREELAAARTESTHASRSSLQLPGRMRQLQPVSKTGKSSPAYDRQEGATLLFSSASHKGQKIIGIEEQKTSTQQVSVKPGDTLWSIAQKYRVHLEHLRSLNRLPDDRILIGQTLWLPDDRPRSVVGDDKGASTP
ncbi:MAG: LysM peptidoglycan-binding domain-containing protein, partial [Nitrospirota bacterium]